jgi:hypothetical protein
VSGSASCAAIVSAIFVPIPGVSSISSALAASSASMPRKR